MERAGVFCADIMRAPRDAMKAIFESDESVRVNKLKMFSEVVNDEQYQNEFTGKDDPRWGRLRGAAETIIQVLKDLGTYQQPQFEDAFNNEDTVEGNTEQCESVHFAHSFAWGHFQVEMEKAKSLRNRVASSFRWPILGFWLKGQMSCAR